MSVQSATDIHITVQRMDGKQMLITIMTMLLYEENYYSCQITYTKITIIIGAVPHTAPIRIQYIQFTRI